MRAIFPRWWRANFLSVEFVVAVLVTVLAAWWLSVWDKNGFLDKELLGVRSSFYAVLATIWGALLGFVIATVTIVLGFSENPRMEIVRSSQHYDDLWKTFMSAMRVLGFATAACVAGLIADKDAPAGEPKHVVFYVAFFATILAALRLARCMWILHNVVRIVTKKQAGTASA